MKAVILAAGLGTRLAPLTEETPKILVEIGGRPLLSRQLRYLSESGVDEVAINVHHHADQVEEFLFDLPPNIDVSVTIFREERLLGTAGALTQMADWLTEPFVVLYGDVLTDALLEPLLDELGHEVAAIAYQRRRLDVGVIELVGGAALFGVRSFREKPEILASVGLYALRPEILSYVRPGDDFGADVFPRLLARHRTIGCYDVTDDYLVEVGTPEGLERARADASRTRSGRPS